MAAPFSDGRQVRDFDQRTVNRRIIEVLYDVVGEGGADESGEARRSWLYI